MDTDTKPKIEQRWFVQIIYTYTMLYLYARVVYIHAWIVLSPAEVATVLPKLCPVVEVHRFPGQDSSGRADCQEP